MLSTASLADYLDPIDEDGEPQWEATQRFIHDYWEVVARGVTNAPLEYDNA